MKFSAIFAVALLSATISTAAPIYEAAIQGDAVVAREPGDGGRGHRGHSDTRPKPREFDDNQKLAARGDGGRGYRGHSDTRPKPRELVARGPVDGGRGHRGHDDVRRPRPRELGTRRGGRGS